MTWWTWLLLWTALVLGAGAVLFLLGRDVWRTLRALTRELGATADRLGELSDRLADLEAAREAVPDGRASVGSSRSGPRPLR